MDIKIAVDCQTKTAYPNCEYCIANKSCMIRETMETDREKKILKWLPQTE